MLMFHSTGRNRTKNNALDPGLRPAWTLVVVYPDCNPADRSSVWSSCRTESEAALVCSRRGVHRSLGCDLCFWHAASSCCCEFWIWRCFWPAEDCLDCAGCRLPLRHFCRDWPIRNYEGVDRG